MKKWIVIISFTVLFMGLQTLRADDSSNALKVCSQGRVAFGKLSCKSGDQVLLDAYFLGASSIDEIRKSYPERFEKIQQVCERKDHARKVASVSGATEPVQFLVESVSSCIAKRGYQEPCQKNSDCIENFCHPDRGTCSAVFTVPIEMIH